MNVLSTITILPSNEAECEVYVTKLKAEILASNDPSFIQNMKWFSEAVKKILKDKEVILHVAQLQISQKDRN